MQVNGLPPLILRNLSKPVLVQARAPARIALQTCAWHFLGGEIIAGSSRAYNSANLFMGYRIILLKVFCNQCLDISLVITLTREFLEKLTSRPVYPAYRSPQSKWDQVHAHARARYGCQNQNSLLSRSLGFLELREHSGFAGERTTGNLSMPEAEVFGPPPLVV
jgi:hypothetical protein